jgi:hydrogenase large subunit
VRSVENALQLEIPLNAQYIRNMMIAAHSLQDHVIHFYQLSALDWVDVMAVLKANPAEAARRAEGVSDWQGNSLAAMTDTQRRLKVLIGSKQLGIFANGYWGHPAMKLSPEANLIAITHYLQALDAQRWASNIVGTLGGKTPHIQNLAVGGVSNPIATDSEGVLTMERLMQIRECIDRIGEFLHSCYLVDVATIIATYPEWLSQGAGIGDFLSTPEIPVDTKSTSFMMPGGHIVSGDLSAFRPIRRFGDPYFTDGVAESVKHAWYAHKRGDGVLSPWKGETTPAYTGFQGDGKYSWIKAPTFYGKPAQVGPVAEILAGLAAKDQTTVRCLDHLNGKVRTLGGRTLTASVLNSTLGRHAARVTRACVLYDHLRQNWQLLVDNIGKGDSLTYNQPTFPDGEIMGVGQHEAPRGLVSHWIVIENNRITNYQVVTPSTWLAAPRNEQDQLANYDLALLGTSVADVERPLEILRTIHSFDPCIACAVHLTDTMHKSDVEALVL